MSALRLPTAIDPEPVILRFPTIFTPDSRVDDAPPAHRIRNPVRTPDIRPQTPPKPGKSQAQPELFPGISDAVLAYASTVQTEYLDLVVPEQHRAAYGARTSVRQFWRDWLLPLQLRQIEEGQLSRATLTKTRQALNRWEAITRPADWSEPHWPGIPLAAIRTTYLESMMAALGRRDLHGKRLSPATVRSTQGTLMTILNYAARVRAIETAPRPAPVQLPGQAPALFTDSQIETAYAALAPWSDLQVAFVLAVNTGLRPVDLYGLRWHQVTFGDRPQLDFVARKTRKAQCVPLASTTVRHLRRLLSSPAPQALLFPGRSNPDHHDPERSREARRRRQTIRQALHRVGIDFEKPHQAMRATCNERLERFREGVGQFVLGHANTLNSKSYRNPAQIVRETIEQLPQPACFHA